MCILYFLLCPSLSFCLFVLHLIAKTIYYWINGKNLPGVLFNRTLYMAYQIWWNLPIQLRRNGIMMKKWRLPSSNFGQRTSLVSCYNFRCYFVPKHKIWAKSVNLRGYVTFSTFQDGGRRHLVFSKHDAFWFLLHCVCTRVPNLMGICRSTTYGKLMICKIGAAGVFNFVQIAFWSRNPIYGTILYQLNPPFQSWGYFSNCKMTAVCHFGIVMTSFKTTLVGYLVMLWVCESFIWIYYNILICFQMASNCLTAFGEFDPLKVVGRCAHFIKAHPCMIPRNLSRQVRKKLMKKRHYVSCICPDAHYGRLVQIWG